MIKTQNLTKNYDGLLAVDDLTFSVEPGEVLGFLGPNGAGKSTTMRMLAGFITPTSGTGSICGHDISTDPLAAKRELGYLPEGAPHYGEMTVGGFLDFVAATRLDRARHAAPHPEGVVRGIDHGIDPTSGDVAFDDFDGERGKREGPHVGTRDAYRSRDST